jgi:ketosteroid isomerase-like protein
MPTIFERLTAAQNAHDASAMARCFALDYDSVQPAHPGREFTGRAQVEANWTAVFAGVPDFRAELVDQAVAGDRHWGEFDWRGTHLDGAPFAMRGVIVATVRADLLAAARLYMEPVDMSDETIDAAVRDLYRPPER